jgi:hypothetical protein
MVPSKVTPPDVPGGTRCPDVIVRGADGDSVPISVAQVSAVEADIEPAATGSHIGEG